MKNLIKALLAVLVVSLVFCTWASAADLSANADFKAKCAACHGQDGAGATPMGKNMKLRDLASPEVQKQTDAQLTELITKGKGKMPAYDGKLSKDQIAGVVKTIRSAAKK